MEKKNFWNEAAKYGVIMALVAILFDVLGFYVQNTLLSLLSLVIFVLLLGYFTKRRAERFGARGYGYGQCLGFMVSVMLCAGFIEGAFMGVASNWLFAARYEAMIGPSLVQLFSGMLASAIKGGFFGLFIAAFTKRDPDVFSEGTNQ